MRSPGRCPSRSTSAPWPSWFTDADIASYETVETALEKIVASIDPADPFAYPDLHRLDQLSFGDFLREAGATPAVLRAFDLVHLSLSDGSIERQSTFAYARKQAVGGGTASYDVEEWENQRVAEGSATVALTMAAGAGRRTPLDAGLPDRDQQARLQRDHGCR